MKAVRLFLPAALMLVGVPLPAQMVMYGPAVRADFDAYVIDYATTFIDFENVPTGVLDVGLQPTLGVSFFSTISTGGVPLSPVHNAYVSTASVGGDTSRKLVGTPTALFGADDGRVGYEVRFDTPQSHAGIERNWQANFSKTTFYNDQGTVLGTHVNTVNVEFVAWVADMNDPLTWVSRIEMDGLINGGTRQVGYSDDLFFGVAAIPEPSVTALLGTGLALLWLVRRRHA